MKNAQLTPLSPLYQLIQQVLAMTQEQIDALPAESRSTIMQIVRLPSLHSPFAAGRADACLTLARSQRAQAAASMGGRR